LRTGLAEAVTYQVMALAIHAELGSPVAAADVHMLPRQRAALGDQEFQRLLHVLADNDSVGTIMQLSSQSSPDEASEAPCHGSSQSVLDLPGHARDPWSDMAQPPVDHA
jgi:hypothetical protein